jgi:hypothetical protein
MRGPLRYISALVMIGFLFGSPAAYVASGMMPAHAAQPAAGHDAHGCDGSHRHQPAGHDALHCLLFSCSPALFLQADSSPLRVHDRSAAIAPSLADDAPRSAVPERDPPVPRLPA